MSRRVYECLTYDTETATCTEAAFVERSDLSTLSVADSLTLLTAIALCWTYAWGWKQFGRTVRN